MSKYVTTTLRRRLKRLPSRCGAILSSSSDPSSPSQHHRKRRFDIENDDVFLTTSASRRSSSRFSTESDDFERRKVCRHKARRCSDTAAFSTRTPRHLGTGILSNNFLTNSKSSLIKFPKNLEILPKWQFLFKSGHTGSE